MEYFQLMIFTLYLIQGMFYGYVYSLPLAYNNIPSYSTLALFAASGIPFSFKFILAPLAQHFYLTSYGKAKTWINSSILACSLFMLPMARYSQQDNPQSQQITASLLFVCVVCIAAKDVAVDSLAVKTLQSGTIGLYTFLGDQLGKLITLPFFLASISFDFSQYFGIEGRFISQRRFIELTALFAIVVVVTIHFYFDEAATIKKAAKSLQISDQTQKINEELGQPNDKPSFTQIFSHFRNFIKPSFRLCRFCILMVLLNQGSQILMQSYPIELMRSKVNRQSLIFAQNLCLFPNAIISLFFSRFINSYNYLSYYLFSFTLKLFVMLALHMITIDSEPVAICSYVLLYVIGSANYFLENICVNEEARDQFSGLSVTLLLSVSNFSRLTVLQKILIDFASYDCCVIASLSYCLIAALVLPLLLKWLNRGVSLQLGYKLE